MFVQILAGHYEAMTICDYCGNLVSHPCKGHDGDYCNGQCEAEVAEEEALEEGSPRTLAYGG